LTLVFSSGCSGKVSTPASLVSTERGSAQHSKLTMESAIAVATAYLNQRKELWSRYEVSAKEANDGGLWEVRFSVVPGIPGGFIIVLVGPSGVVVNVMGGE
jgi:hypothetical protein